MKKILPVLAVLFMSLLAFQVMAQTYVPITISSGFNQDIIANGNSSADASTSTYFDHPNSRGVYYTQDFYPGYAPPCGGLPNSGSINSANIPGVNYQLANYSGNNCLLLVNQYDNGTLSFSTAGCYERISLCAASAVSPSGTVDFEAELNFSDGSHSTYNFQVPDWFAGSSTSYCIQNLGRTYRSGGVGCSPGQFDGCLCSGSYICAPTPICPFASRLFDCVIILSSGDKVKVLNSITCTKNDPSTQKCAIFAVCGVTAAGAPMAIIADAATVIGTTSFQANWHPNSSDPNPPTSYRLDVSTDPSFGSFVPGYNNLPVSSTSTTVTGLSANTTYHYRVRGVNSNGVGPSSNVIDVTTLNNVPLAIIADPATSVLGTRFQANWHPNPSDPYPPTSYRLDVSTDPAFGSFVTGYNNLDVGSAVTWPVTGLNVSTTYHYRVRGVNIYGTGPNSNVIDVTTTNGLPPAPVATPATAVIQIKFWAHWNAGTPTPSEPVDCYYLDVATTPTFDPGTFVGIYNNLNVGLNTMCLITGTTPGTTYYYRVRAHNQWGLSIDSNVITVITVPSNIPTLSEWGLIILGLVLLGAGTLYITRWHS